MEVTSGFELLNLTFLCTTKIHHVEEGLKGSQVSRIGVNKVKKNKLFLAVMDTSLATRIENLNISFLFSTFFLILYRNQGPLEGESHKGKEKMWRDQKR
jgi:hypothetical protein